MDSDVKRQVVSFLEQGQRINAIKYLVDSLGIGMEDARNLVDAAWHEMNSQGSSDQVQSISLDSTDPKLKETVIELIKTNKKIEAIKLVKEQRSITLKEALIWVDEIHKEIDPKFVGFRENAGGCVSGAFKLVAVFFGAIGFLLLGSAVLVYWFQSEQVKRSDKIAGTVTSFKYSENTSAPIVTYQWNNQTMTYESNSFSYPPAYELNETVDIYVDRNNPAEVLIDSFFDRWFLITLLGGIGLLFTFLTFAFMIVSNKSRNKAVTVSSS